MEPLTSIPCLIGEARMIDVMFFISDSKEENDSHKQEQKIFLKAPMREIFFFQNNHKEKIFKF